VSLRIAARFGVACRVLNIARQPYYGGPARPVTTAEVTEARRADALFDSIAPHLCTWLIAKTGNPIIATGTSWSSFSSAWPSPEQHYASRGRTADKDCGHDEAASVASVTAPCTAIR
jgi:hypothetical protein